MGASILGYSLQKIWVKQGRNFKNSTVLYIVQYSNAVTIDIRGILCPFQANSSIYPFTDLGRSRLLPKDYVFYLDLSLCDVPIKNSHKILPNLFLHT